ncbi:MAG: alpha-1,4-glucan--maltose-1-phosphate maltosyltransferase [Gaiellaceae bacterium]
MAPPRSKTPPPRIQIERVWPQLDCGRYPVKRTLGESVDVWADIFRDGHEVLRAAVRYRRAGARRWREAPMQEVESDRWTGGFEPDALGLWEFTVAAWTDRWASWRWEIERKVNAGQKDLAGALSEGAALLARESMTVEQALDPALAPELRPDDVTTLAAPLAVDVDRPLARVGAWYELFPRSWGGFEGVGKVLPQLADLGFDVLYLPPIHPIGTTQRKGRNNTMPAKRGDPGSPWAIGAEGGGHTAVEPALGSLEEFERLVARAREAGIDVALDFAIQCSPDHPWLREHPEWFNRRPDGTLKYAENPPKRYQDIYNVNFDSEDWRGLWKALRDVVLFWVERGVRVFRVDNPHTKPVPFWEWLIREVRAERPEVIFLSEAFTRPAMMQTLAKAGFSQSYTYFTWKNTKAELAEFMTDLTRSLQPHFLRPNFFVNTPDILHAYLQRGGRPAFEVRLILAATLSPSYGLYSGYEHWENVPVAEGSEEYLHSEKYEAKRRKLDGPLLPLVRGLNEIRRENPALQRLENLEFLETENEHLIAYAKRERRNVLLVCANLDPGAAQEGVVVIPAWLGLPPAFAVEDLLGGETYDWRIGRNYVRLDPRDRVAHVLRVVT